MTAEQTPMQKEANRLRWEVGLGSTAIGCRLGVSASTVCRWTDAERAERDRKHSRGWKARNASRVKAYDAQRVNACPRCDGQKHAKSKLCNVCEIAARRARMRAIQAMWKDGLTHRQIATTVGTTEKTIQVTISRMRRDGWDMPYRAGYPRPQEAA